MLQLYYIFFIGEFFKSPSFVIDSGLYLKLILLNSVIQLPVLELKNNVPLASFIPDNWTGVLELHFPIKTFREVLEFAITRIFLVKSSGCI